MAEVLQHKVKAIGGGEVDLSSYAGKVVLFVNVASACGYTPQYKDLEALWRSYREKGVVVLGFPSNDFGAQEPGTEAQIQAFCSTKFDVTFPMFAKVKVKGDGKAAVYDALAQAAGEPAWNFHKYLVGKDGRVIRAFKSSVAPLSKELTGAIDAALAA